MRLTKTDVMGSITLKKYPCEVCGTRTTLMAPNSTSWLTCNECFEKVDAMAAKEDRWPAIKDYVRLKSTLIDN